MSSKKTRKDDSLDLKNKDKISNQFSDDKTKQNGTMVNDSASLEKELSISTQDDDGDTGMSEQDKELHRVESIEESMLPLIEDVKGEQKKDSSNSSDKINEDKNAKSTPAKSSAADSKKDDVEKSPTATNSDDTSSTKINVNDYSSKPDAAVEELSPDDIGTSYQDTGATKATLEEAIKRNTNDPQSSKRPTVWIVLTFLFLVCAIILGVLYYMAVTGGGDEDSVDSLKTQLHDEKQKNTDLQSKLDSLKTDDSDKKDQADNNTDDNNTNTEGKTGSTIEYRFIPEWDIRYKVDKANRDFVYHSYKTTIGSLHDVDALGFSTQTMSKLVDSNGKQTCKASDGAIGTVIRFSDSQLKTAQSESSSDVYNDLDKHGAYYYYLVLPPDTPCSDKADTTMVSNKTDELKKALGSIESTISLE